MKLIIFLLLFFSTLAYELFIAYIFKLSHPTGFDTASSNCRGISNELREPIPRDDNLLFLFVRQTISYYKQLTDIANK